MANPVAFSSEDMLRDKILDPGWYVVLIKDVVEGPSKDGGSTNYNVEGVVVAGASGESEFAGVPLRWNFNSKAISFAIGFLRALGVDVQPDTRYDLARAKDQTLQVYVRTGSYQDRPKNEVTHAYRPANG
jgi:hypothetical protein